MYSVPRAAEDDPMQHSANFPHIHININMPWKAREKLVCRTHSFLIIFNKNIIGIYCLIFADVL